MFPDSMPMHTRACGSGLDDTPGLGLGLGLGRIMGIEMALLGAWLRAGPRVGPLTHPGSELLPHGFKPTTVVLFTIEAGLTPGAAVGVPASHAQQLTQMFVPPLTVRLNQSLGQ